MKYFLFMLLFVLGGASVANAQKTEQLNCKKVRTGKFELKYLVGDKIYVTFITRTKTKQTEVHGETGAVLEFDIKWTSDCSYELSNPRVLEGEFPGLKPEHKLFTTITEVGKFQYKSESTSNFSDMKITSDLTITK